MPILKLYGHEALSARLLELARSGELPPSLLLHGPAGIGKQRLALLLAQTLLCEREKPPCGECQHCRFSLEVTHPDLMWVFPRPRPKDSDTTPEERAADLAEAIAERVAEGGIYARPGGDAGIFIATVRILVRKAVMAPALARRKVFVIGDAERMAPQEGAEAAANAFLKLLEEPPADTFLILTSSEPASLLPTIRSRVAGVRVTVLKDVDVRAFLADPAVKSATGDREDEALLAEAAGAPGRLFGTSARATAIAAARKLLAAAHGGPAEAFEIALSQGVAGARGGYTDMLEALTLVIAERTRDALQRNDTRTATEGVRAVQAIEHAKEHASGNVNPQLLTWRLLRELGAER
jgi:DNA polymerase III subunit delta'